MKGALLSLRSTRRKVRCILSPLSLDACVKGSVCLCSYPVGGSTYCGVGALLLLGKWPISPRGSFTSHDKADDRNKVSAGSLWETIRYLIYRQVPFQSQDEESEESDVQALGKEAKHLQGITRRGDDDPDKLIIHFRSDSKGSDLHNESERAAYLPKIRGSQWSLQ